MKKIMILLSIAFLLAWSNDPNVNTPICDAAGSQNQPQIISDGVGGAFIVWQDYRRGNADIYAQRIDTNGNALWVDDGVIICAAAKDQLYPKLISDRAGGAIITWMDCRGKSPDIYAQRISSSGNRYWAANGIPICTDANWQENPQIIPSGINGAIIAWSDYRRGWGDAFAQRINGNGQALWTANGVPACQESQSFYNFVVVPDSQDGIIIIWGWGHGRSDNSVPPIFTYYGNTFGQKLDSQGNRKWTSNGIVLNPEYDFTPKAISDGAGGAAVAHWGCDDKGYGKITFFGVNADGILQWKDSISNSHLSLSYDITRDESGNIYLAAMQYPDYIHIRKVSQSGQFLWMNSISVSIGSYLYNKIEMTPDDSAGGVFVVREYGLANGSDNNIYVHRIDSNGVDIWSPPGAIVCSAIGTKSEPHLISDGSGGTIVAWMDKRTGESNIYGQKICSEGDLDKPQPPNVTIAGHPVSGKPPLKVSFTSTVTGDQYNKPFYYSWDFGDGSSSTETNPAHTYTATGQYTATLTVTDSAIAPRSGESTLAIDVSNFPITYSDNFNDNNYNGWTPNSSSSWFMYNPGSGDFALNGQARNSAIILAPATAELKEGNIVEYDFNIRSGLAVTKLISGFVFDYQDNNNYSLVIMNGYTPSIQIQRIVNGTVTTLNTGTMKVLDYNTWYHFKADLRNNLFTVEIDGVKAIDSYNYGTVAAMRTGLCVNSSSVLFDNFAVKRDASLDGNTAPQVSISANILEGTPPIAITFTSTVIDKENDIPLTYNWNFGDGSSNSSEENPIHTFTTTGQFIVTCSVTDSGIPQLTGSDTLNLDIYNYVYIFDDDFSDGNISDWNNLSGAAWSLYQFSTIGFRLAGATAGTGTILAPYIAVFNNGNIIEYDFLFRSGQTQTKKKFGFLFDYQSSTDYALMRFNYESNTIELYKYTNGNGSLLFSGTLAPIAFDTWYHFKATMTSGNLTVSINRTKVLDNVAYGTITSNSNGLWVWASSMFFNYYSVKEIVP